MMGMGERALKLMATIFLIWALMSTALYLQQVLAPPQAAEPVRVSIGIKRVQGSS
ncbi:hypothetical protein KEJ49_08135 [Candidatus Bathyarchaeota archaeon]|nr:hypothetical protein [Candidatus Bathyarchaeota archaeon]